MKTVEFESRVAPSSYVFTDDLAEADERSSGEHPVLQDSSKASQEAVDAEMQMVLYHAGAFLLCSLVPLLALLAVISLWPEVLLVVEPHQP